MVVPQAEAHLKPTSIASVEPISFVGRIVQSYFLSNDTAQTATRPVIPNVHFSFIHIFTIS